MGYIMAESLTLEITWHAPAEVLETDVVVQTHTRLQQPTVGIPRKRHRDLGKIPHGVVIQIEYHPSVVPGPDVWLLMLEICYSGTDLKQDFRPVLARGAIILEGGMECGLRGIRFTYF